MKPPVAIIAKLGAASRLRSWLVQPPRWANSMFAWSLTGAFAAGAGNALAVMMRQGTLAELGLMSSLGVTAFAALAVMVLFLPFLVSAGLFFLLIPRRTPSTGALWMLAFHGAAHLALINGFLGYPLLTNLEVPILVASLWGLWLPRIDNPEGLPGRVGPARKRSSPDPG